MQNLSVRDLTTPSGKALQKLLDYIRDSGQGPEASRWFADGGRGYPGMPVVLPGYDLFSPGSLSPALWHLSRPCKGRADYLRAYEAFVDRPLGKVRDPSALPLGVFADAGTPAGRIAYLRKSTRAYDWYTPALRLLACARFYDDISFQVQGVNYSAHFGPQYLEVTPRGCYSNTRRCRVEAGEPPEDIDEARMPVPAITISDPAYLSLYEVIKDMDTSVLYALNAVVRGILKGELPKKKVAQAIVGLEGPKRGGREPVAPSVAVSAAHAALDVIDAITEYEDPEEVYETLEHILIPNLMGKREFSATFGRNRDASLHPLVIKGWRMKIKARAQALAEF